MKSTIAFFCMLSISFSALCAEIPYEKAQGQIVGLLKSRSEWIVALFAKQSPESGLLASAGIVPVVMKKISVLGNSLTEVSEMSTRVENGKQIYYSAKADLSAPAIPMEVWLSTKNKAGVFKKINTVSFSVETKDFKAIIYPAKPSPFSKNILPEFKHMTAPLAIEVGLKSEHIPPPKVPITVLRHDLSKTREVYVDKKFPAKYHRALILTLMKWNQVLRTNFYQFKGLMNFDPDECVATDKLCILWSGSEQIPWAGVGGISVVSYDPVSGLIGGGLIGFYNSNQKNDQLLPPDKKLVESLSSNSHFEVAANLYLKREQMQKVAHPYPRHFLESLLLHEFGHDVGLNHYFMGSMNPEKKNYSDTVMDYMPFPVFHTQADLGSRDTAKINRIYFNGKPIVEKACSDMEVGNIAFCLPGDIGPSHHWLMKLAEQSDSGVTQEVHFIGGMSAIFGKPEPIYKQLMKFTIPNTEMPELPNHLSAEEKAALQKQMSEAMEKMYADIEKITNITKQSSDEVKSYLCNSDNIARIKQYETSKALPIFELKCQ